MGRDLQEQTEITEIKNHWSERGQGTRDFTAGDCQLGLGEMLKAKTERDHTRKAGLTIAANRERINASTFEMKQR